MPEPLRTAYINKLKEPSTDQEKEEDDKLSVCSEKPSKLSNSLTKIESLQQPRERASSASPISRPVSSDSSSSLNNDLRTYLKRLRRTYPDAKINCPKDFLDSDDEKKAKK